MKKLAITILLCLGMAAGAPLSSRAQSVSDVIQQLVLDYQKLASLKNILGQMYSGYAVLTKGYGAVKDVAQRNFSLHEAFLDGLYILSPTVRKYPRVSDIINDQAAVIREYKSASGTYNRDQHFSPDELAYIMNIYHNLVSQSLKNLDDLSMIVTDSKLRMSDAERLAAIDGIYLESHNQLSYLRKFNDQAARVTWQRAQGTADKQGVKSLYGLMQ